MTVICNTYHGTIPEKEIAHPNPPRNIQHENVHLRFLNEISRMYIFIDIDYNNDNKYL